MITAVVHNYGNAYQRLIGNIIQHPAFHCLHHLLCLNRDKYKQAKPEP